MFSVQTYTCITFLAKRVGSRFKYERINSYNDYNKLDSLKSLTYSYIYYTMLYNKKWRLLRHIDYENIKSIENFNKLGQLTEIRVGIATLKDSVYFVDGSKHINGYFIKQYRDKEYLIEDGITKRTNGIYLDFNSQEDIDNNKRRIIFPYKINAKKASLIPEDELRRKYQKAYEYLLAARKELETREKGKGEYPSWYAYGRTQGLNFCGPKLLTLHLVQPQDSYMEKSPDSLFCNGYAIYLKNQKGFFGAGLTLRYFIKNIEFEDNGLLYKQDQLLRGRKCYMKKFIELFGIPDLSKDDMENLEGEDKKEEIDKFLINKYGITI